MQAHAPRGVLAPILTPFEDDLTIADDLFAGHAERLLVEGCAALSPFGTTGEALSVGLDERIGAMKQLVAAGIDPALLLPGTGLTSIADTARLTRACLDLGCCGVLVLPPFYYKGVSEEGLYAYFARLIEAVRPEAPQIYLYHIPPVAMVGLPPSLVRRLFHDFPEAIAGIKDSSGDWKNTTALLEIEGLAVYPGSEVFLLDGLEAGSCGCITATANTNSAAIAEVFSLYELGDLEGARAQQERITAFRKLVEAKGNIPAQKRLLALETGDARWATVRPPLLPLAEEVGRELADALSWPLASAA